MSLSAADVPADRPAHRRIGSLGAGSPARRMLAGQLVRFAAIGSASTAAFALLYLLLRGLIGAFEANFLALLVTAVGNTAANRRLTFGVRGVAGVAGDHAVGLLAFAAGVALTSGALALQHLAAPRAGRYVELAVLAVANAVATLVRFVALRLRIRRGRVSLRRPL